jgi:hypothetical protein
MKKILQFLLTAIWVLLSLAGIAQNATQVSITGAGSVSPIQNNVATPVNPSLVIGGNGNINGFTVTITGSYTNGDILAYNGALPEGITTNGFVPNTRSIQFFGTASPSVWEEFLRRVTLRTTSATCFPEQRKVSFNFGLVYYNILNDHFYRMILTNTSWTNARNAAEASSYYGYQGYLTTVTSAAENTFIQAFTDNNSWIGCSDNVNAINGALGFNLFANQAAAEGKWYWVTGPERGTAMRTGNENNNNLGSNIAGVYQNWSGGEPNDWPGSPIGEEDYGHVFNSNGLWNDFANTQSISYLIEFGGMPNDDVSSTVVYTCDVPINGAPISGISGGNTTVCPNGSATLELQGFQGSVVRWEYSTDNFLTPGVTIASTSTQLVLNNIPETRYYRAIVNSTSPACSNLATASTPVFVSTLAGGSAAVQNAQICQGGTATVTIFGNEGESVDGNALQPSILAHLPAFRLPLWY